MRKLIPLLLIVLLAGCDLLGSDDPPMSLSGSWSDTGFGKAFIGECCTLSADIIHEGDELRGSATVRTPTARVGSTYEYNGRVEGTVQGDRVSITINSGRNTGRFTGTLSTSETWGDYLIEGRWSGFGERADMKIAVRND